MYLAALWVRARDGSRYLNVVLYRHDTTDVVDELWSLPPEELIREVTTRNPGRRVAMRLGTVPGGNHVESFLDVVARDGTPVDEVREAIAALRAKLQSGGSREWLARAGVVAEFSVVLGERDRLARFDELAAAAIDLFEAPSGLEPLTIEVTKEEAGLGFRLSDQADARLAMADLERMHRRTRVRVRFDVKDAFEQLHGSIYPHAAEWVTGLSREQLHALGGARFVQDGRVVWSSSEVEKG